MDPRIEVIENRLENVNKLIPVASGKGGVGKSLVASTTALLASEKEYEVGLLDLDLHGPSTHVILGAEDHDFPEEDKGIIPPKVENVKFMSTVYYSQDKPSPLRGDDISNAIREILSITRWGSLDYLIVDMPPGIGNETLDTIQLMPESEFLLVTTPSKVSLSTVKKLVNMLKEQEIPIAGVIENMKTPNSPEIKNEIKDLGVDYLGEIRFDHNLESTIGNPKKLLETDFAKDLDKVVPEW
ncbi:ATP-binding protein [candidate division MSBL1 archaeon SCGC-AAA382F02]|uniref:ATP-binding protein n=1 Tax=candidate division MSBL1 archaeon SCGC-AAA382F02 TaxID=1698282 RepID=A0A133VJ10_9EURY|nr:ATP-binding protein [candidate division MSBL1 archaeon SCGC-AAA382F02]